MADTYVCSGAIMKCSMGTCPALLTVLPSRTAFLTEQPQANISDHKPFRNLGPFGNCCSMSFPATASATAAAQGVLTPMPCSHNTPFPWMGGKNDYLIKGHPALLKSSTCQCMWGGTISLITDGQISNERTDMNTMPPMSSKKGSDLDHDLQAANKENLTTDKTTPYTEAEKHYQELQKIDSVKILEGLPTTWKTAFNEAFERAKKNYKKDNISEAFSDIELAHNIYKLATSEEAKIIGYKNISYKMPHQVFDIADKVPGYLDKMPKKKFWDSFDKYIPLYTNIYEKDKCNAYFSPYFNSVVISVLDDDNIKRFTDSDWFKSGLLHHEFGHAYDYNHGWKNDDKFLKLYEDFKKEIKEAEKNGTSVGNKINGYIKKKKDEYKNKHNKSPQYYSDFLTSDEIEMLTKISDCLQAATDNHIKVFGGHQETITEERDPLTGRVIRKFVPGYFDEKVNPNGKNNQMAEFIAHASENYWSGNVLFEEMFPETYGKMQQLLKEEWTIPNTKGKKMPIGANRPIIL